MWQWVKCFFGFHRWQLYRKEFVKGNRDEIPNIYPEDYIMDEQIEHLSCIDCPKERTFKWSGVRPHKPVITEDLGFEWVQVDERTD
jgi:hypothetical protein